ncbi:hypothetical protein KY290_010890 [Solanum tuberosum]|uniref:SHSP domain-containing protein n=1 Tax=Solanum tuberosum TaxID=4113 RepID=A0ABQ7VZ20_SOLTU|nr:hypothetical protein KY290_010890 [Solanum tuberosum]
MDQWFAYPSSSNCHTMAVILWILDGVARKSTRLTWVHCSRQLGYLLYSGSLKHQGKNEVEQPMKAAKIETSKSSDVQVVNVGPPVDWVKINVRETNDSFEVYALVPGLLQDEVRVQFDPADRLVITGQPNQLDNLWGVTAFKKVVTLPARIDQLRTNADVTLHECLHAHVPFAQQNL